MDFVTLFRDFNPHIYLGGDSTAFWGPLAWTMIFGLGFATFLTLIMVPVMYLLSERIKNRVRKLRGLPHDSGVDAKPLAELITSHENF
jgi:Cu/Ag efflux pump CusA